MGGCGARIRISAGGLYVLLGAERMSLEFESGLRNDGA